MNTSRPRRRAAAKTASLAVAVGLLAASAVGAFASAASGRTATTSVDTTYLSDTLGVPVDTVIETVTYDRLQWLLKQPGQFAFLIGSATDAGFPANAVKADAAAKAAGAAKIYWYDPNLTGLTGVQNLNTRVPSGINLVASSQTIYGNTWKNLLGQHLGNGIKSVPNAGATTVAVSADDAVVNDAVDPVWDYRSTETAAVSATDDVFFIYDKDNLAGGVADKIVSWVNLSSDPDVAAAIGVAFTAAGGGAVVDQLDQFQWWKYSANKKHDLAYPDDARYGGDILDDADAADGWRVKQITYPELLHLLKINAADSNFVILFGGTWCHNTRAVIKDVNEQAQENGIGTVYNFDLVLDGGTTNGTNGGSNPIHVRDNANSGVTTNFRPSWVYGDTVRTYFKNLVTEYDPNTGSRVSYYPAASLTAFPDVVRKLQVPFLINYERGTGGSASGTAIKRQWIQQNTDPSTGLPTYKEYMSEWWFTHPTAQLGLATSPAPTQAQLDQAKASAAFGAEALVKLQAFFGGLPGGVASNQTIAAPTVTAGTAPTVTLTISNDFGRVASGTATLAINGLNYPVTVSGNKAVFTLPTLKAGTYPFTVTYPGDAQIVAFTKEGTLTVSAPAGTTGTAKPTATKPATKPSTAGNSTTGYSATTSTPSPEPSESPTPSPSAEPTPEPSPSASPAATSDGPEVSAAGTGDSGGSGGSGALGVVAIAGGLVGAGGLALGSYNLGRRNPLI